MTDGSGDIEGLNFGEIGVDFTPAAQGGAWANTGGFKGEYMSSTGHNGFVIALDANDDVMWSWTLDDPNILGVAWENAKYNRATHVTSASYRTRLDHGDADMSTWRRARSR